MKSPIELIMVSEGNNNKFYRMKDLDDGNFQVEYGRVGVTSQVETYPISRWDSKYKEKLKKGYRDVSDLKIDSVSGEFTFKGKGVDLFYQTFSKYTKDNVGRNYTIAVGAVTKSMLDEAQDILNHLSVEQDLTKFNRYLLELYMVLPRRMSNVKDYLVKVEEDKRFKELVAKEQDVLDSLSSSVVTKVVDNGQVFEESLGIEMELIDCPQEITDLFNKTNNSRTSIYKVFKVKHSRQNVFDEWVSKQDNKNVELLFHGTRNPNVFSILKSGLLVRPTNAVSFAGSVYGCGLYFSDAIAKSINYTGYDSDKCFFVEQVHVGKQFVYEGWYRDGKGLSNSQMNYPYFKSVGCDSLHVKAGDGLLRDEFIVYNEQQACHGYLIWAK